jgi:hypothetical protein
MRMTRMFGLPSVALGEDGLSAAGSREHEAQRKANAIRKERRLRVMHF